MHATENLPIYFLFRTTVLAPGPLSLVGHVSFLVLDEHLLDFSHLVQFGYMFALRAFIILK